VPETDEGGNEMNRPWQIAAVAFLVLALVSGCGCIARRAVEHATGVTTTDDGKKMTVKGEKGEKVTFESQKGDDKSGTVKVTTSEGTTTTDFGKDKVTEKEVGIAFYPGAEVEGGGTVASSGKSNESLATVSLVTSDPMDKVAAFYKDKYAKGNTVVEQGDALIITVKVGENAMKMITVGLDKDAGKTRIGIQSMTN
jgi:hypothetical protein